MNYIRNILIYFFVFSSLLYFIFINKSTPVYAENLWHTTTPLPYNLASHTDFSHANKIYIINGSAEFRSSKFKVLLNSPFQNGNLSQWLNNASDTPTALIWHVSAINNSYVYILGGKEENIGSAMSHVSKVFFGKLNNNNIEHWTPSTSLPQALSLGGAVSIGNKLFYAGGMREDVGNIYSQKVYMAGINDTDGTLGTWSEVGNLPEALSGFGMFNEGNNIILIGGENSTARKDKVYRTNINPDSTIGTWTETASLPKPLSRAQYVKSGNKIFALGGLNSDGTSSDDVYFTEMNSDGTVDPWQLSPQKLPQPTCCGTGEAIGDYLYLIGGHNMSSGEYYDDVYFANINEVMGVDIYDMLDVPYFSQNSSPWGQKEYDHAKTLKFANTSFERWGCAVTSVAMIMRYHNINVLPNGTTLDPGSLNKWLKDNKGYLTGKDKDGAYSYLNFPAISTLSKKIFDADKSRFKLEYYREKATTSNLDTFLNINKHPVILKVNNSETDTHFVVAKGKTSTSYNINDPEWDYQDLSSFNNTFSQIDRFVPVYSNLSYITIVVNPKTHLLITDRQGRKTGSVFENGQLINYDEIPSATYSYQTPISNPDTNGQIVKLGTGVNEFLLPKPINGNYTIQISSLTNREYEMNISTFQENGNFDVEKIKGNTKNNNLFEIEYNQRKKSKTRSIKKCDKRYSPSDIKSSNKNSYHDDDDCYHHDYKYDR